MPSLKKFKIPTKIQQSTEKQQVSFLLDILEKYRIEIIHTRQDSYTLKQEIKHKDKQLESLFSENYTLVKKLQEYKTKVTDLEEELKKYKKTNNRYKASLFKKGKFTPSDEQEQKKEKGGQKGHLDTNRESKEKETKYIRKRVCIDNCPHCDTDLPRVNGVKSRKLIDIPINPKALYYIIDMERQWCSSCKKEIRASDERSLPFTEYSLNVFLTILLLRVVGNQTIRSISGVMKHIHGLSISESVITSLLNQASNYLGSRYEELKDIVRSSELMYNDETGWSIQGKSAWMWIMANDNGETVYIPSTSRGKKVFEDMYGNSESMSMHDGYGAYINTVPKEKQLKCWAHILRFSYEESYGESLDSQSVYIRDSLVRIYKLIYDRSKYSLSDFESLVRDNLLSLLSIEPNSTSSNKVLSRLKRQFDGLVRSLCLTSDGTNNLAERELRTISKLRKISYGSNSYNGMCTTAILSSVLQSIHRNNDEREHVIESIKKYLDTSVRLKGSIGSTEKIDSS